MDFLWFDNVLCGFSRYSMICQCIIWDPLMFAWLSVCLFVRLSVGAICMGSMHAPWVVNVLHRSSRLMYDVLMRCVGSMNILWFVNVLYGFCNVCVSVRLFVCLFVRVSKSLKRIVPFLNVGLLVWVRCCVLGCQAGTPICAETSTPHSCTNFVCTIMYRLNDFVWISESFVLVA